MTMIDARILSGVRFLEISPYLDSRGRFIKDFSAQQLASYDVKFGIVENFYTISKKNVFRGLHIQIEPHAASKIVSVVQGKIRDFVFDLRPGSKTFGRYASLEMSEESEFSLYIPTGLAHGYITLTENTIVSYKTDAAHCKVCDIGINPSWVLPFENYEVANLIISERDRNLGNPIDVMSQNVPH